MSKPFVPCPPEPDDSVALANFDRATVESVELAKAETARERAHSVLERIQAEQDLSRVEARFALKLLIEAVGCQQLVSWLWMEAAIRGEALTLPIDESGVRR